MSWKTLNNASGDVTLPDKTEMDAQRGLPGDVAWNGTDAAASHTSIFKRMANFLTTLGLPADAAWDGTAANPSNMSVLKRIAVLLGATDPAAIVSLSAVVTGTFTRPADTTAYTVGDLVANNITAASVVAVPLAVARANGTTGSIRRMRLTTTDTTAIGRQYRVHLFKLAPTVNGGDNLALVASGRVSIYLGSFDVTMSMTFSDGCKGIGLPTMGGEITFDTDPASQNVYALLETRSGYTPITGEVFSLAAETFRD